MASLVYGPRKGAWLCSFSQVSTTQSGECKEKGRTFVRLTLILETWGFTVYPVITVSNVGGAHDQSQEYVYVLALGGCG